MGITTFERPDKPFVKQLVMTRKVTLDAAATDATNTVAPGVITTLRRGLILGYHVANAGYIGYNQAAADAAGGLAHCILLNQVDMKGGNPEAAVADQTGVVMWIGEAVSTHCLNYHADAVGDLQILDDPYGGYILFDA